MSRKKPTFYKNIRNLREDNDMTQAQAAKALGLQLTTYARYENGEVRIPADVMPKIAKLYHVTTDYIFGLTKKKM